MAMSLQFGELKKQFPPFGLNAVHNLKSILCYHDGIKIDISLWWNLGVCDDTGVTSNLASIPSTDNAAHEMNS